MIEEIERYLDKFIYLGSDEKKILSAWVLHTWAFNSEKTPVTSYIYLHSPEKQCGKTVTLDVLKPIAFNTVKADSVTPAALFGIIEGDEDQISAPCVMIDEIDATFYGRKNEDLRQLINSGYKRNGAAIRSRGGRTREYSTFCPKIMAGIHNGSLPDTVEDRCVPVTLQRAPMDIELEYFSEIFCEDAITELQEKIAVWVDEKIGEIESYRFWKVPGLSNRQSEICWPLLAAANADGVDLTDALVRSYTKYDQSSFNADREFLLSVKEAIEVFGTRGKLCTMDMLDALDMPRTGKGQSLLATQMGNYGVESKSVRLGNTVKRGFDIEQFSQAFRDNGIV